MQEKSNEGMAVACIELRLLTSRPSSCNQRPRRLKRFHSTIHVRYKTPKLPPCPSKRTLTYEQIKTACPNGNAENVEQLRLSQFGWTHIEQNICSAFHCLQTLNLSDNQLTSIAVLAELPLLRNLDVASNALQILTDWPNHAFALLERLDLSYNLLSTSAIFSTTSPLGRLPRLTTLNVEGNGLARLPSLIGRFHNLSTLRSGQNRLICHDLDVLAFLSSLQYLYVQNNRIRRLPDRRILERARWNLKLLELEGNPLRLSNFQLLRERYPNLTVRFRSREPENPFSFYHANKPHRSRKQRKKRSFDSKPSFYDEFKDVVKEPVPSIEAWKDVEDPTIALGIKIGMDPNVFRNPTSIPSSKNRSSIVRLRHLLNSRPRRLKDELLSCVCRRSTTSSIQKRRFEL